jgi:hypothetical protein
MIPAPSLAAKRPHTDASFEKAADEVAKPVHAARHRARPSTWPTGGTAHHNHQEREGRKAGGYRCRWPVRRSLPYRTFTLSDTAIRRLLEKRKSAASGSEQYRLFRELGEDRPVGARHQPDIGAESERAVSQRKQGPDPFELVETWFGFVAGLIVDWFGEVG